MLGVRVETDGARAISRESVLCATGVDQAMGWSSNFFAILTEKELESSDIVH